MRFVGDTIAGAGIVEARTENIAIGSALPGVVLEVYVPVDDVGKEVTAGEALFRVDDRLYALDNACLHVGGPLAEGLVEEGCVTCPWHEWRYRLEDGRRIGLGDLAVASYRVRVAAGEVWVQVGGD